MMRGREKRGEKKGKGREAVRRWWEAEKRRGGGGVNCTLGLGFFLFILGFFLNAGMIEPVRFGSVQLVSDFENRNQTESELFYDILIG